MYKMLISAIAIILISFQSVAAGSTGILCIGADIKSQEKDRIYKELNINANAECVTLDHKEEKNYLPGVSSQSINSKASVCSYVVNNNSEGLRIYTKNIAYVTPEMIASSMITAGIKDVDLKVISPYSISGSTAVISIIKAYEKLEGSDISKDVKIAAAEELVFMGDLGQKIGMQKSLQFTNEIKKAVVKDKTADINAIKKIISNNEKRFNISLDDMEKKSIISIMDRVRKSDLSENQIAAQQKNFSTYFNDFSETTVKTGFLRTIIHRLLYFLKEVSMYFTKK